MNLLKAQDTKLKVEANNFALTVEEGAIRGQKKLVVSHVLFDKEELMKLIELSEGLDFYIIPNLEKVGFVNFIIF